MQISYMIDGPVELVTFDLYDTLVEADPPRWQRFHEAVTQAGFDVSMDDIMRADTVGEQFYTMENGRRPIRDRGEDGIREFRLALARQSMEALGLPTDHRTVSDVQRRFHDETQNHAEWSYRAFKEIPGVLRYLEENGIKRAIISNADADVTRFCLHMGFATMMDTIVTSALVGWEKPDGRTFHAALEAVDVRPERAIHVGDQPLSDVLGARGIGMAAALIDRYGRHTGEPVDALPVTSLEQLAQHVIDYNRSFDS